MTKKANSNSMAIEWHEECLKNHNGSIERMKRDIERLQENLDRSMRDASHYAAQISRAKRENKTRFDRERFKV